MVGEGRVEEGGGVRGCICVDEMGIWRLAPLPLVPLEAETLCDRFLEHALNRHAYRQSTHGLTQRITTATARMWR